MLVSAEAAEIFQKKILEYYAANGRHTLPWRRTRDAWLILLAEITLRKTTSQQAAELYPKIAKYSPQRLLDADSEEIEELLQPLGLQRIRAQGLKKIARAVLESGMSVLESEQFLLSLPGVGRYITNAVRCNAFGVPVPTLDTNMIRVISRVFSVKSTRSRAREDQVFWDYAAELVHPTQPREFNWGVLDLGAQVCTVRAPKCPECPLKSICAFYKDAAAAAVEPVPALPRPDGGTQEPPTAVSLFSGAGGFDWGFHRAGFKTVLACELTPDAAETLAKNLHLETVITPTLPADGAPTVIQGNIEEVDFEGIKIQPDVLIGGPPCQDFSVSKAQEREGLNGGRGHLYREFVRALMYFQPKLFVFENVPGLTSANKRRALPTILHDLRFLERTRRAAAQNSPYRVPQTPVENYVFLFKDIVEAVRLGAPQTRRRLILIGMREDLHSTLSANLRSGIANSLEMKMGGHSLHFSKYPLTSMEAFEGKPLCDLQVEYKRVMEEYRDLAETSSSERGIQWKKAVWDCLKFDVVCDYLMLNQLNGGVDFSRVEFDVAMREHEALLDSLGWRNRRVSEQTFIDGTQLPVKQSQGVENRMFHIPPDANADYVIGTDYKVESKAISFIYRRTAPLKPAFTVMAYGGGGTHGYHYERSRSTLTLRERARIQTFSDDFLFYGQHIRAQIGEAVPPLLGEKIADSLRDILALTG